MTTDDRPGAARRYFSFAEYLRRRFGCRVYRVPLHAGFTCPNRDGTVGAGGCIYCNNASFNPRATAGAGSTLPSLREQLREGIVRARRRYRAQKFLAYFQPFTNTYAPVQVLKARYDLGIDHPDVVGMAIGTRPDCVPDEVLDLVQHYTGRLEVWIEYGLQSMHDRTLVRIHRGHGFDAFVDAVRRTRPRGIKVCAHVILGLPGETHKDMMQTARACSELGVDGVKIHHLHVLRDTPLADMYCAGEVHTLTADEYIPLVCDFLERLAPRITIQRLMGDAPGDLLVAPKWDMPKTAVLAAVTEELRRRGTRQGAGHEAYTAACPTSPQKVE